MKEVYIVSAVRTPIGSWGGALKDFSATKLGSIAIKGALERIGLAASEIDEVLMGSVMQANLGPGSGPAGGAFCRCAGQCAMYNSQQSLRQRYESCYAGCPGNYAG